MTESDRTASVISETSWLLAVAAATFIVVSIATRFGIGISTDSVVYIAEARQLVNGEGLTVPTGLVEIYADVDPTDDVTSTAHFPPLYPLVIALAGLAHDSASSFRWLNALLLVATALILAVMVERYTSSRWLACLAVGMVVLSPPVLRIHSMAWSEPLFITLGFAGLLALARFLENQRPWTLVTGSAGVGLAWLTRYVGIAFVLTGLVALLLGGVRIGRRALATFLVLSVVPMAVYLGAMSLTDMADGFTLLLERPAPSELRVGFEAIRDWFRPASQLSMLYAVAWVPVFVLLYLHLRRTSMPSHQSASRRPFLPILLAGFIVTYSAVLLASISVLAEYLPLEERYLVPPYVAFVALAACALSHLLAGRIRFRQPVFVVVAMFITATAVAATTVLDTGTRDYPGFEARFWRESAAMEHITRLPKSTHIYSNYPEAIYFRTGREARLLPKERLPGNRRPRHRTAVIARLVDDVRTGDGVVVFFTNAQRDLLTSPSDLVSELGVLPRTVVDALIYQTAPDH